LYLDRWARQELAVAWERADRAEAIAEALACRKNMLDSGSAAG
jgi:hypothetical protein